MHVQFNTDNNIEGYQRLQDYFSTTLSESLSRFDDKITGLKFFLADENSEKEGQRDKRCTLEAHVAGLKPIAVTEHADTLELAVSGATDKLKKVLTTTFEKMRPY